MDTPIGSKPELNVLFNKFLQVFQEGLGTLKGLKAKLTLKARNVPYSLVDKVDAELDRLEHSAILQKVEYSKCAAPIVPVVKPYGNVRICGDFKVTVNLVLQDVKSTFPKIENMFAKLAGSKLFSQIDLTQAYL